MIRVMIDRIVLDGVAVPPGEGAGLRESVTRELAALMGSDAMISSQHRGGAVPVVDGGTMVSEGKLAARIAHSVHGAIGSGTTRTVAQPGTVKGTVR